MKYDVESINKRKAKTKNVKRIIEIISIILIYNIILIIISSINGKDFNILGYKAYIINTNSMEPTIKVGDIVIIKKNKPEMLNQGDVITFSRNGEVITHRITKIEESENNTRYITKGDNNNTEDSFNVTYQDIIGEEVLIIPYLGKIMEKLDSKIILLIVILIILIYAFVKIQKNEKLENRREKKKIEEIKNKV